jgi:hypothetical protein
MDYTIESCFHAGPTYALELFLKIDVAGSTWDANKPQIQLQGKHVMSLRLEDNLIVHQIDYVDYAEVTKQVATLQDKHGRRTPPQ